jgi:hypothetical protein
MKAVIISDGDAKTELSENLKAGIVAALGAGGNDVRTVELEKDRVAPCLGCFRCATSHGAECTNKDAVSEIKRDAKRLDLTLFVTPVVFGHFSSTVKNAVDRGTFSRHWDVVIGYGSDVDEEERSTFLDLTAKHCGAADIVHPGMVDRVDVFVTTSAAESAEICDRLRQDLLAGAQS